jgi:threonine dehydrogenase-like Zn-dependent dehydrogenase
LSALEHVYRENDLFLAGSLVEITASAFNAVIMRGGGISPGENAVVLGGGPVGLAACTILRRQGAARVILYESNQAKAKLGLRMGASHIINPLSEDSVQRFLEITEGYGARFFLEATGQPDLSFPNIEEAIWRGKCINAKVVIAGLAWAGGKISVTGNIFQAREASVVGASGNSGYGIYPRVISAMASGMDMTPLITEKISLSQVPEKLIALRKDNKASKVIVINFDG